MQRKKILLTLKNTAIVFAITVIYCIVKNFDMSDSSLYVIYLGDFSIGLCSRMLIGSILSLFKDSFTEEFIINFVRFFTFAVFLVSAHFTGSAITQAKKENKKTVIILTALLIACPFSITVFAGDIFGFIDVFCMLVFLSAVYMGSNRILMWALPVILAAGVFLHDCYITGYMAPCLGVLAYYAIRKYQKKLHAALVFILSSVLCAVTSFYTVVFAKNTVRMTETQMLEYLANKGNCSIEKVSDYFENFLFYKDTSGLMGGGYGENIWVFLKYMIIYTFDFFDTTDLIFFVSTIPLLALIFLIWIKAIKNSRTFMDKIPYILFILTVLPQLASLLFSNDFTRFLAVTVIVQFIYLFIAIKQHDENIEPGIATLNSRPQYFILPCLSVLLMNII